LLNDLRVKQHALRDGIDTDTRNTALLGVAGLAIAAALGIACQKKISEALTD
jgi:hypothetical protein